MNSLICGQRDEESYGGPNSLARHGVPSKKKRNVTTTVCELLIKVRSCELIRGRDWRECRCDRGIVDGRALVLWMIAEVLGELGKSAVSP